MLFVMKYGIVIIKIKRKNDSRVFNQILHKMEYIHQWKHTRNAF